MQSKRHQTGLTLISWIILIALVAFAFWFGFSLFPLYLEYYNLSSAVQTSIQDITVGETPQQILHSMDMRFTINGEHDDNLTPEKIVTVAPSPNGNGLILTLDYEARTNFIGNVYLLAHFHKTYRATPH